MTASPCWTCARDQEQAGLGRAFLNKGISCSTDGPGPGQLAAPRESEPSARTIRDPATEDHPAHRPPDEPITAVPVRWGRAPPGRFRAQTLRCSQARSTGRLAGLVNSRAQTLPRGSPARMRSGPRPGPPIGSTFGPPTRARGHRPGTVVTARAVDEPFECDERSKPEARTLDNMLDADHTRSGERRCGGRQASLEFIGVVYSIECVVLAARNLRSTPSSHVISYRCPGAAAWSPRARFLVDEHNPRKAHECPRAKLT